MMINQLKALILCLALVLSAVGAFAQTAESDKLLALTNPGVIQLILFNKEKAEIGRGTALVLSPKVAVTSYHLISPAAGAAGFNFKKKDVDVDGVLGVDKALDLAILQIDGKVTPLAPGDFGSLVPGKKFFVVAANEVGDIVLTEATVRNVHDLGGGLKIADTAAPLADSFTGGAAVDETGKVLGLVQVVEKRLRLIAPMSAVNAVAKAPKATAFKNWQAEDYFATIEANWLFGRIYAWVDEGYNAQRNLEKVVKVQPGNLAAWKALAKGYDGMRDYQNAITAYKKVTELDPKAEEAFLGLGQIYARMQRSPEAVEALNKALELNPGGKEAYLALGEAYEAGRDFAKAGDAYDKYLAAAPADLLTAYQRLGLARMNAEQFDKSRRRPGGGPEASAPRHDHSPEPGPGLSESGPPPRGRGHLQEAGRNQPRKGGQLLRLDPQGLERRPEAGQGGRGCQEDRGAQAQGRAGGLQPRLHVQPNAEIPGGD